MSTARCHSAHLIGLSTEMVIVEVDISNGLHSLSIVGLGDRAVGEAKDRVCAAIKNSGYVSPKQKNQKVVISLAPADIRKEGPAFDLAMALSYLLAAGEISFDADKTVFLGELSLKGDICRVHGILPMLCALRQQGFTRAIIPADNANEASLADGIAVYGVSSLKEAISLIVRSDPGPPITHMRYEAEPEDGSRHSHNIHFVRGNEAAKRALEVAAAGGHNVLMYGPPGTGKTMLAQSFSSLLPPLSREEAVEVTSVHSAANVLKGGLMRYPPFRSPHHTASYQSIVGGGASPRPGEITLAHRGILFLDELPEFDRAVLEALREPLESRAITISRSRRSITFPARCILLASMNPCPCGKFGTGECACTPKALNSYHRKVSGPIMDRIDMWVNVSCVDYTKLSGQGSSSESSVTIRARVAGARTIQAKRFDGPHDNKKLNSDIGPEDIDRFAIMHQEAKNIAEKAARNMKLSGRSFHKIIKMARTIADLAGEEEIGKDHILEALQYRQKIY